MGKSVFRVFCIELGVGKVCSLEQKFSSLLVFVEGMHEKNPQKTQHMSEHRRWLTIAIRLGLA